MTTQLAANMRIPRVRDRSVRYGKIMIWSHFQRCILSESCQTVTEDVILHVYTSVLLLPSLGLLGLNNGFHQLLSVHFESSHSELCWQPSDRAVSEVSDIQHYGFLREKKSDRRIVRSLLTFYRFANNKTSGSQTRALVHNDADCGRSSNLL